MLFPKTLSSPPTLQLQSLLWQCKLLTFLRCPLKNTKISDAWVDSVAEHSDFGAIWRCSWGHTNIELLIFKQHAWQLRKAVTNTFFLKQLIGGLVFKIQQLQNEPKMDMTEHQNHTRWIFQWCPSIVFQRREKQSHNPEMFLIQMKQNS